jgi:hypothetical protein
MLGNTLTPRFKNPFDVTVEQAVGLGGGLSRQSINDKQQVLRRIRIEGEWLIKIKPGKKTNNTPALYEINYDLLVPQSLVMPTFGLQSSRKIDGTLDGSLDDTLDDTLDDLPSILRSEEREKRGDVGGDGDNFNWLMDQIQNVAPGSVLNDTQRQRMIEFSEAPREKLQAILQRFAERGEKRERLISWIDGGLRDWDRLYGGGNGGDAAHRAEWKRELDDMERELKEELADPHPDNVPWVKQTRERIANRRRMLNGGN